MEATEVIWLELSLASEQYSLVKLLKSSPAFDAHVLQSSDALLKASQKQPYSW